MSTTREPVQIAVEMNGGEAVVATLREEGIEDVFGIVASSILEVFNLLPAAGLRYVGVRHEQVAAHMADGYARIKGVPAVCLVQNGGGVTNLTTGFATALKAHSPIVGISGTPGVGELDRDTFQELDQLPLMRPVTKWSRRVPSAARIGEYVRAAVREATTPPMGPVFLEIPRNFLYEMNEVEILPRGAHRISSRIAPDSATVAAAAELLLAAERPLILAGGGVVWAGAESVVCQLAEQLQAPVCTSYQHNDAVPSDHAWALGSLGRAGSKAAMRAIAKADCVLALGSRLAQFSLMPYWGLDYFPHEAQLIQVDVDPSRIGVNRPIALGIVADAGETAQDLLAATEAHDGCSQWQLEELAWLRREWKEEWLPATESTSSPLQAQEVFGELRQALPADAVVVTDVGGTPSYAFHMLDFITPRSLVSPLLFGSLGFALGAAIGAKLAAPDRPVVALLGDGALTMSLPALITAVEYKVPFVALVFDNACWGAELVNQTFFNAGAYVGTLLKNPPLAEVARSLGCLSFAVGDRQQLRAALGEAFASDIPAVVAVDVDRASLPEPARKDALRVPLRGLFKESG